MAKLATQQKCEDRIRQTWAAFQTKRSQRMESGRRFGTAAEKITIALLEDLFSEVLDWSLADLNHEIEYADFVVTQNGIKTLIVEAKRPGSLAWHQHAVSQALEQARRYADSQRVPHLAITDGIMLYAADIDHGVLQDRVFLRIDQADPPWDLWWLSVHGIYRPRPEASAPGWHLLAYDSPTSIPVAGADAAPAGLLHSKYKIPATCFAYVGDANRPATWRLPYRLADGSIDRARLPKAIQAILSNYRGTRVRTIPEEAIPDVLLRLARAASQLGNMPSQAVNPAPVYQQLASALNTLGIAEEQWQRQSNRE